MTGVATGRYSVEALTPRDVAELCAHFGLPTPTPDVGFDQCLRAVGRTADELYAALVGTTSVPLMIAAAALRGTTRLPPDPRLNPRPLPPSGPPRSPLKSGEAVPYPTYVSPVPKSLRKFDPEAAPLWLDPEAVITEVKPNPKKASTASYDRFSLWRVGATVREMRTAGLTTADFRWDVERGYVVLEKPSVG